VSGARRSILRGREALMAVALTLGTAASAFAHPRQGQAEGFVTGMSHPVSGLDHVLAMIAVGLWGAQLGPPAIWLLPVTFPIVMAFGGFLALIGVRLPGVDLGVALSAVLLGLMVAREAKPPIAAAAVLVGFFAIFHGHAHGSELPAGQSGLAYSIGFVVATGCLHGAGIAIGVAHRWTAGKAMLRLAGLTVALAGAAFVWRALA